jgi:hypothetical protein
MIEEKETAAVISPRIRRRKSSHPKKTEPSGHIYPMPMINYHHPQPLIKTPSDQNRSLPVPILRKQRDFPNYTPNDTFLRIFHERIQSQPHLDSLADMAVECEPDDLGWKRDPNPTDPNGIPADDSETSTTDERSTRSLTNKAVKRKRRKNRESEATPFDAGKQACRMGIECN